MAIISYRRHRFPPVVLQQAVWLCLRSALSYRDVEKPLAERGLDVSYESVRSWVVKFAPAIARALWRCRPTPSDRWHLDEMVVRIASKQATADKLRFYDAGFRYLERGLHQNNRAGNLHQMVRRSDAGYMKSGLCPYASPPTAPFP